MEKIKASEILMMNPKLSILQLRQYKFFAIDSNGSKYVYEQKPDHWGIAFRASYGHNLLISKEFRDDISFEESDEWKQSLREIDFSVDVSRIINNIKSELKGGFHSEISSQDLIVNHDEVFMPAQIDPPNHKDCPVRNLIVDQDVIGDSDVIYKNDDGSLTTTRPEPARIFELDDIVHIMYGSDFGKSVLAKVIELLKTNLVRIKFENEMTMIIEERFLSFAPFSYEHGGFTQVRPMPEPKVGDWGFFYDEESPVFFCYGKISKINNIKEGNYPYELKGILELFYRYKYFSYTMPELAEDVPVPNTTNQQ